MTMSEKQIIKEVLGRMGDDVPVAVPFEELGPVYLEDSKRGKASSRFRPIWTVTAVAVGVLIVVGGAGLLTGGNSVDFYVADGESVISTDPPIVQGAESPELAFDTSGLGDESPMTPVTDISRIMETSSAALEREIIRVTALGETPEGVLAIVIHAEGDSLNPGRGQFRCLATLLGASSCGGFEIESAAEMPGGLLLGEPGLGPSYGVSEVRSDSSMTWEVPSETSVATLTINGETIWQRPVSNVAVFVTELVYGDKFQLTAYDAAGAVLDKFSATASVDNPGS